VRVIRVPPKEKEVEKEVERKVASEEEKKRLVFELRSLTKMRAFDRAEGKIEDFLRRYKLQEEVEGGGGGGGTNVILYNAIAGVYAKRGKIDQTKAVFDLMQKKGSSSFSISTSSFSLSISHLSPYLPSSSPAPSSPSPHSPLPRNPNGRVLDVDIHSGLMSGSSAPI